MPKILYGFISSLLLANVALAGESVNPTIPIEKIPLAPNYLSSDKGGSLSAADAYKDGVGIVLFGDLNSSINNKPMNVLVYKYGKIAKEEGSTVLNYVLTNSSTLPVEDVKLAQEMANLTITSSSELAGVSCDDGDADTYQDVYDNLGVCKGLLPTTCAEIKAWAGSSSNGSYQVYTDNSDKSTAYAIQCDMVTDGGGWKVIFDHDNSIFDTTNMQLSAIGSNFNLLSGAKGYYVDNPIPYTGNNATDLANIATGELKLKINYPYTETHMVVNSSNKTGVDTYGNLVISQETYNNMINFYTHNSADHINNAVADANHESGMLHVSRNVVKKVSGGVTSLYNGPLINYENLPTNYEIKYSHSQANYLTLTWYQWDWSDRAAGSHDTEIFYLKKLLIK